MNACNKFYFSFLGVLWTRIATFTYILVQFGYLVQFFITVTFPYFLYSYCDYTFRFVYLKQRCNTNQKQRHAHIFFSHIKNICHKWGEWMSSKSIHFNSYDIWYPNWYLHTINKTLARNIFLLILKKKPQPLPNALKNRYVIFMFIYIISQKYNKCSLFCRYQINYHVLLHLLDLDCSRDIHHGSSTSNFNWYVYVHVSVYHLFRMSQSLIQFLVL